MPIQVLLCYFVNYSSIYVILIVSSVTAGLLLTIHNHCNFSSYAYIVTIITDSIYSNKCF